MNTETTKHKRYDEAFMSRRGNCYDNALMESFWSTLKCGLIHRTYFDTRAQACAAIFEWKANPQMVWAYTPTPAIQRDKSQET